MTKKTLKAIIKWLLLVLPWTVAAALYVYSWNRGGGISGWSASFFISIALTWVWCFILYKSERGGDLEFALNLTFGVLDIIIAFLGFAALLGEVVQFAVAISAHIIVFGIFRTVRNSVYEGKVRVGGISIAYFTVGVLLMLLAVLV